MALRPLAIGRHLVQQIIEHCRDEKPYEACGILTGRGSQVLHAYATDNIRRSPIYYEVDPEQQEYVLRTMEEQGEELVAIYHSHPTAAAVPSVNDIRLAVHYPKAIRVIISLAGGPADMKAFLIVDGAVQNVPLEFLQEAPGAWCDLRSSTRQQDA